MKKKFAIGVVFLMTYLGFLVATLPATVLFNQMSLPKNISLSGVSGSVWKTSIEQVFVGNVEIKKIKSELSFWSLFSLAPRLPVTFGDSLLAGPEGEVDITFSQGKIEIENLSLLLKANEIAQQLTLPLPVTAKGDVEITLYHAAINIEDNNKCIAADGLVTWSKAGVIALEQNIQLGNFTAKIACEEGALALLLSPQNDLGLTLNAYARQGGRVSGNGFLKPGAKFPQTLNSVLPFLGRKDSQGRYRLSF
ncbi:type II secretion system protein N [Candidatus Colwellia aromaticivorans]|uniref:type II secretion system protein N n=1 Tax=Candidatus Colwellia aromaticivorans TaxID=2267621 RepID=UPI000DF27C03|nr:type II secretion system protein N [Candidatus Colwellia aromaticivorans]